MGNIIDISGKITNQLPVVKITDDIVVTVNNRKSNMLIMQAMVEEMQRKAEKDPDNSEYSELALMDKTLSMLVGQKQADAINELDLPLPEYKMVYEALMNTVTGNDNTPS